jgi:hypothetical protein
MVSGSLGGGGGEEKKDETKEGWTQLVFTSERHAGGSQEIRRQRLSRAELSLRFNITDEMQVRVIQFSVLWLKNKARLLKQNISAEM